MQYFYSDSLFLLLTPMKRPPDGCKEQVQAISRQTVVISNWNVKSNGDFKALFLTLS